VTATSMPSASPLMRTLILSIQVFLLAGVSNARSCYLFSNLAASVANRAKVVQTTSPVSSAASMALN